jgi:DNA-binding transcriptional ArsR family regulator
MPITLTFGPTDLLRCRFAISPLWETQAAIRTLLRADRQVFHQPWLRAVARHEDDIRTSVLPLLLPPSGYTPDFLTPPPTTPLGGIEEDLDRIRETPVERVSAELGRLAAAAREPAPALHRMLADPARARDELAALIGHWWRRLVAPDWNRMRDTLDRDVAHRANRLAQGGIEALAADLHASVHWSDDRVIIAGVNGRRDLAGLGLVLVPSIFGWPNVSVVTDPPWQPTLIYPARGVGDLWARQPTQAGADHLAALLGSTRAAVLREIREPISTTNLAVRLGLSPSTVSAHLTVLRNSGLASAHRAGHQVRYELTALGHQLMSSPA